MPAMTAASFTVALTSRARSAKRKLHRGTLTFGNGVDTYVVGGVPLPDKSKFGFSRIMEDIVIDGMNSGIGSDYVYRYVKSTGRLVLLGDRAAAAVGLPLSESSATEAPIAKVVNFVAYGW